ncbi:Glutathione-dependent formaldehyde-activating enzyme/centromere protein V [Penicillium italicum]|uniref:Glutathione-dependent formaldehyde-activating enzyme/centromere protein V n=1 Tax=Penicillium italicum TaxID=40296 RepID=A0A0A2KRN2_PENIT|nr:Glutathione-dependent formaldehyde-activating enzyme/centromere protein V [Penicillium italicum]
MADSKTPTAGCHCQTIYFTITIPANALLLKVHICHCSVCRYTHGTPCISHAPLLRGVCRMILFSRWV